MSSASLRDDLRLSFQKRSLILFSQILEGASRGQLLTWGKNPRLTNNNLVSSEKFQTKLRDSQVMAEFRGKLRLAEDLIAKLGYSLREITNDRD